MLQLRQHTETANHLTIQQLTQPTINTA